MKFVNHAIPIVLSGILTMFTNGCNNTPKATEQAIRFGVVADIQFANKPVAIGRHYADSLEALKSCVEDLSDKSPAFTIQLGDMIDGGPHAAQELETIVDIYRQLPTPTYHTLGNHDFEGLDRASVQDILGMDESYYHFDIGRWRFVILDTQDVAVQGGWDENSEHYQQSLAILETLKAVGSENAVDYDGGIGAEQIQWLKSVLEQADTANKNVLVFGHLPLMPIGEKHTLWNSDEIVVLFEAHNCVKAYFCGHQHGGGYNVEKGIYYVTFEAMVDAADKGGAWALVTLSNDKILIEGTGSVTSRVLTIDNSR